MLSNYVHGLNPNITFKFDRYNHIRPQIVRQKCEWFHNIDPKERCEFITNAGCDSEDDLVKYHDLVFCKIENPSFTNYKFLAAIVGMIALFGVMFLYLAITVNDFFCPALGVISKIMRLSENLAGVTILAMGNSAPDIMACIISRARGSSSFMYNGLLGGVMFVTALVAGWCVIVRPFRMQAYPFIRDQLFITGAMFWLHYSTDDESVSIYEASSYVAIYVVYMAVVLIGFFAQTKINKYMLMDEGANVDWTELRKKASEEKFEDEMTPYPEPPPATETNYSMCKEFFIALSPASKEEWLLMTRLDKWLLIIKGPLIIILKLIIPVVDFGAPKNGWCKLLYTLNTLVFPSFVIVAFKLWDRKILGLTIFVYFVPIGGVLAILLFFTSKKDKAPRYHLIFGFFNFLGTTLIMFLFVKEIVGILNVIGTVMKIQGETLGITILSWGNGLSDAISNINISKQGFQRMAFPACFAGALGTSMLSMGITFLYELSSTQSYNAPIHTGAMGPQCIVFLQITLVLSLLFVLLTNFEARKSYGYFLIISYCEFLLFCVLCELGLTHPLGADHEDDY